MNRLSKSERRYDIDWLRIISVLLLVPYHSALIFVLNPDSIMYIKDTVNSVFLSRAESFISHFAGFFRFNAADIAGYYPFPTWDTYCAGGILGHIRRQKPFRKISGNPR